MSYIFKWAYADFVEESVLCGINGLKSSVFHCLTRVGWAPVQKTLDGASTTTTTCSLNRGCVLFTMYFMLIVSTKFVVSRHRQTIKCICVSLDQSSPKELYNINPVISSFLKASTTHISFRNLKCSMIYCLKLEMFVFFPFIFRVRC